MAYRRSGRDHCLWCGEHFSAGQKVVELLVAGMDPGDVVRLHVGSCLEAFQVASPSGPIPVLPEA